MIAATKPARKKSSVAAATATERTKVTKGRPSATVIILAPKPAKAKRARRGRKPQPWYRQSDGFWYVQIAGKQFKLAAEESEAWTEFHRLMAEADAPKGGDSIRIDALAEAYLEACELAEDKCVEATQKMKTFVLQDFCRHYGALTVAEFDDGGDDAGSGYELFRKWIVYHKSWRAKATRRHYAAVVKSMFLFGVVEKKLTRSPIAGYKLSIGQPRHMTFTPEQEAALYDAADPCFRLFLKACFKTGARPGSEIAKVTAADVRYDAEGNPIYWQLRHHKTARYGKGDRIIRLSPEMQAITRQLVEKHPKGPLFRNRWGRVFTNNSFAQHYDRLRKKFGWPTELKLYCARHTFATRLLKKAVSIAEVAALLGNSITEVARTYAHVDQDGKLLNNLAATMID